MENRVDANVSSRVAVFAYAAGIDTFHEADRNLVRLLKECGFEPSVVQCNGVLQSACPVTMADGVIAPEDKRRVLCCTRCKSVAAKWRREADGIKFVSLESLLQDKVPDGRQTTPLASDGSYLIDYRKALYSELLLFKCRIDVLLRTHTSVALAAINSYYQARFAAKKLFESGAYLACFVNNALYGTNRAVWESAEEADVTGVNVVASSSPEMSSRAVTLESTLLPYLDENRLHGWRAVRDAPLSANEIEQVERYLYLSITPNRYFRYSSPASSHGLQRARTLFNGGQSDSVVLVVLSSPDERQSAESVGVLPSETRDSHLRAVQEFIQLSFDTAIMNPETTFIIRIHPRLSTNSRDFVESPYLKEISDLLEHRPQNVLVNEPSQRISIYDVASVVNSVMTMGSTAGVQLAALGLPVILGNSTYDWTVPHDVYFRTADTPELVTKALRSVSAFDRAAAAVKAFRYLNFFLHSRLLWLDKSRDSDNSVPDNKESNTTDKQSLVRKVVPLVIAKSVDIIRRQTTTKLILALLRHVFSRRKPDVHSFDTTTKQRLRRFLINRESLDIQLSRAPDLSQRTSNSDFPLIVAAVARLRSICGLSD